MQPVIWRMAWAIHYFRSCGHILSNHIMSYPNLAHGVVSYHITIYHMILYCFSLQHKEEQHPFESNVVNFGHVWGEWYKKWNACPFFRGICTVDTRISRRALSHGRRRCPSREHAEHTRYKLWEKGRKGFWVHILQVSPYPMTPLVSADHVHIHPPRENRR